MRFHLRPRLLLSTFGLIAAATACSDNGRPMQGADITTLVEPSQVVAGGQSTVSCLVAEGVAPYEPGDFSLEITGPAQVEISGEGPTFTLHAQAAGEFQVACVYGPTEAQDPTGASWHVIAGDAVATRPSYGKNPILAGEVTEARCVQVDAYGNEMPLDAIANWELPDALTLQGAQITGTAAGSYLTKCGDDSLPQEEVTFKIIAGEIAGVRLFAQPERAAYLPESTVTLDWELTDSHGNGLGRADGTLTVPTSPAPIALTGDLPRFRLSEEGRYRFSVQLDAPYSQLSDSLELLVDGTAPEISLFYPPRGATLSSYDGPVIVRGKVVDNGEIASLIIDGEAVTLGSDGSFSHPVTSEWGLNIIEIDATDTAGNTRRRTPAYAYSDQWLSFEGENARSLRRQDGIMALLGQDFFDDGVHDHTQIDDLATLMEIIIGEVDIQTPLSDAMSGVNRVIPVMQRNFDLDMGAGIAAQLQLDGNLIIELVAAETTALGDTYVGIDSRDGGLDVDIDVGDARSALAIDLVFEVRLQFDVTGLGCLGAFCLPIARGEAYAQGLATSSLHMGNLMASMKADIHKDHGQPTQINIRNLDSGASGFDLRPIDDIALNLVISLPDMFGISGIQQSIGVNLSDFIDLGDLFAGVLNPIADTIGDLIPQILNPILQTLVGPLLANVFDLLVLDTTFTLPSLFGGPDTPIGFYTDLDTIRFEDDGNTTTLSAGIHTELGLDLGNLGLEGDPTEDDPLGAIVRGDCLGISAAGFTWDWESPIGLGLRTDVVNTILFGLWYAGGLNGPIDLGALGAGGLPMGLDELQIGMEWLMPPMVDDCRKGPLEIRAGDLYLTLDGPFLGSHIQAGIYVDLAVQIHFTPATLDNGDAGLAIQLANLNSLDFEVVYLDDGGATIDIAEILESLPDLIGSLLGNQVIGPIALPSFALGDLIPGLPASARLGLRDLDVSPAFGYVVVQGGIGP